MSEVVDTKPTTPTETTPTPTPTTPTEKKTTETTQTEQKVDVEAVKSEAVNSLLSSLGIESEDSLKSIVGKIKEEEEKNKTELQKMDGVLKETTRQLLEQKEQAIIANAKLSALQQGAKLELVDDLVIIAKSKVTDKKDVSAVIAEMKESETGKIYFVQKEDEKIESKENSITRKRITDNIKETKEDDKGKFSGTFAARLLAGKKKETKSGYFS